MPAHSEPAFDVAPSEGEVLREIGAILAAHLAVALSVSLALLVLGLLPG